MSTALDVLWMLWMLWKCVEDCMVDLPSDPPAPATSERDGQQVTITASICLQHGCGSELSQDHSRPPKQWTFSNIQVAGPKFGLDI